MLTRVRQGTEFLSQRRSRLPVAGIFLILVCAAVSLHVGWAAGGAYVIAASVLGGYMALNIGANDVANNIGPAVGSRALTIVGALILAAIFEAAGAIIAGGDVVKTVSKGIIDPTIMPSSDAFIWAMMATLLAAAVWVNLATWVGAPVSTTHAVVGGVAGAGIAAAGLAAVNWVVMAKIAASWVISPVLGGVVAAGFLWFVKARVINQKDRLAAARRWVPVLVATMAAAFSMYLVMKGLKRVWKAEAWEVFLIGGVAFAMSFGVVRPIIAKHSRRLENRRASISRLFVIPLIGSAALLSFAHGANDVANAIGPLAAIVGATSTGGIAAKVSIPPFVMIVGAIGISVGLMLFGPKLIHTVGQEITRLDPIRAFCVALSAAITVIIATALGLPVSSTHIAVGGVFGVGFLREYLVNRDRRPTALPFGDDRLEQQEQEKVVQFALDRLSKPVGHEARIVGAQRTSATTGKRPNPWKIPRRKLVRRSHVSTIIAAWLITVPSTALMAAVFYFMLRGALLP